MSLMITTLIENMPSDTGKLIYEHGFSAYIEFNERRYLFDTGQTGAFMDNAKHMGISLEGLDGVIVSHGHYDHSGGIIRFLKETTELSPLYVGDEFFLPKYKILEDGTFKFNGNSFKENDVLEQGVNVNRIKEPVTQLAPHVFLFKNFPTINKEESMDSHFFVKKADKLIQDSFDDEIVLGLETNRGLVLIVGCSHIGIVNILTQIKKVMPMPIYTVLGGTHLVAADEKRIDYTVRSFKQFNIHQLALSHCTGQRGMEMLQARYKERFIINNTGHCIHMDL